jgi:hypothetical protein
MPAHPTMSSPADAPAVWARQALTRRVLCKVTAALGRAGVDVLAVKGVVTSGWLYAEPGERPLTDLDVRVRPRDFGAVVRASAAEGWRLDRRLWSYRTLMLDVDGISVDVESRVGPPGVTPLSVDRLFARASRDPQGFWVPEAHDHALLLTLNVFKDKISGAFPWALEDVARVVDTPGFDPRVYVGRVREAHLTAMAWVVADWMARERQHASWRTIRGLLGGDAPPRARYASRVRRLFATADPFSLEVRLMTRVASDDPLRWPFALAASLAFELEVRRLRRRSRAQ